ncbi:hypothetical protein BT69DRAFT_1191992, partial [Atractiella rhizophila]
ITDFLYEDDQFVFREATHALEADDSHTVEVRFRLILRSIDDGDGALEEVLFASMEGKGMLMHDRLTGANSHT